MKSDIICLFSNHVLALLYCRYWFLLYAATLRDQQRRKFMANDIFALWDDNKTRISDIPDIYTKNKYLLTRNSVDARKSYQKLLEEYRFSDMSDYIPSSGILKIMPSYCFFLQFKFFLSTPFISRDDEEFYICDNPVRKDKVFKVPMVSGSSWKGNMRWMAGKDIELKTEKPNEKLLKRIQLVKLFGNENEAEERYFNFLLSQEMVEKFKKEIKRWTNNGGLKRGRLNFYPTFFNRIGLEVINPHDRKTKAGTQPIYIESVPEGAVGTFSLLYMPFDLMGRPEGDVKNEVIKDMEAILPAIKRMMLTYGFSAKKSSGFGIVREDIKGTFKMSGVSIYKTYLPQEQKIDDSNPFAKLATLKKSLPPEDVKDDNFSSFRELGQLINRVKEKVIKNDK